MIKFKKPYYFSVIFAIFLLGNQKYIKKANPKKPNIIYILADDLGIGDVSSYNPESKIKTPSIDGLISNGVKFNNTHTSSSVCSPTRYSILTGRYNWRSKMKKGVLNGYSKEIIPPNRQTIASFLKSEGYHTACIGKWHLGWTWDNIDKGVRNVNYSKPVINGPNSLGFDYSYCISASLDIPPYVYLENGKCTVIPKDTIAQSSGMGWYRKGLIAKGFKHDETLAEFTFHTLDYIENHANDDKPFFIYFPLTAPHTPILPSKKFKGKSGLNDYGDFVLMVDDVVKQVVDKLKKEGIYDNTIIVFTSDNGCSPSADYATLLEKGHNPSWKYRGTKSDIFDGGHRVPFIISWPAEIKKAKVSDQLVCTTDFFRTVSDLLNKPLTDGTAEDSYSFLKDIINTKLNSPSRDAIVNHSLFGEFAIQKGEWKLILTSSSGGWSNPKPNSPEAMKLPPYQLYNTNLDVAEQNNLFYKKPEKVAELKKLLTEYVKNGRSTAGTHQKNDDPQYWPQLSWINK
nr:arylsulfatase [uncultured Pedobacter sp.]